MEPKVELMAAVRDQRHENLGLDALEVRSRLRVDEDRQLLERLDIARVRQIDEVVIARMERRHAEAQRAQLAANADVYVLRRFLVEENVADLHHVGREMRAVGIELFCDRQPLRPRQRRHER